MLKWQWDGVLELGTSTVLDIDGGDDGLVRVLARPGAVQSELRIWQGVACEGVEVRPQHRVHDDHAAGGGGGNCEVDGVPPPCHVDDEPHRPVQ